MIYGIVWINVGKCWEHSKMPSTIMFMKNHQNSHCGSGSGIPSNLWGKTHCVPCIASKKWKKTHMYITPKSQKPLWRLFKHIVPTRWISCPWDSWPQCSRIPLCWACHPHPLWFAVYTQDDYIRDMEVLGGYNPQKWSNIAFPAGISSLNLLFWGVQRLAFGSEPRIIRSDQWNASDIWRPYLFWRITHHKSLKQANISHLTVNSVELGESGRLQPTYLCSARKVSTVFKHSPSTCSNTCAGRILAQG